MKALTLWEPWASLIAIGAKPYEFRGWVSPKFTWNTRIVLHAGVRKVSQNEVKELIFRLQGGEAWTTALKPEIALPLLEKVRHGLELPLGHALGTIKLGIPTPSSSLPGIPKDSDRIEHSKFAWPVSDFRPFVPPVPCKGAQGFWDYRGAEVEA